MTEEVNSTLITAVIKGLRYNKSTKEYSFNHKKYKLREVKELNDRYGRVNLYFVNINEPTDLKMVTAVSGIPTYDGFNNCKVDKDLRAYIYNREYYKRVTVDKRKQYREEHKEEIEQRITDFKKRRKEQAKVRAKAKEQERKERLKPKKCEFCGELYTPKQANQRFCCHTCYKKYNTREQAERTKEDNRQLKLCANCGKKFIGTARDKYCSKECYKQVQARRYKNNVK